jgi:NAD(P)-dependent dehydrogenase (short-subunit alcohol dehydrogenase family)
MPRTQMSNPVSTIGRGLLLGAAAFAGAMLARRIPARRRESFQDKVVLITGGARGLGLAMARGFAHEGATLVLLARSADQLQRAGIDLSADGTRVMTMVCDVRDQEQVDTAIAAVLRDLGRIDVLVNNAGVVQVTPFVHAQLSDFEDSLNTHFWGPLFLIQACLPHFMNQGEGRIVNISSVGGRIGLPHLVPYSVGKFALAGFSDALHAELAPLGISVTTVTPFLMRTGEAVPIANHVASW